MYTYASDMFIENCFYLQTKVESAFVEGQDDTSGLPYLHLTFLMHNFVPRRYVETLTHVKTTTVVGCYAEGTRLPSLVFLNEDGFFAKRKFSKDPVVVFLHSKDIVIDFPKDVQSDDCNHVICCDNVHTGYCRLKMLDNQLNASYKDLQVDKKGICFLSSTKSKQKFDAKIKENNKAISGMLDTLLNTGDSQGLDHKFSDIFTGVPNGSLSQGKRPNTTMGLRGALTSAKNDKYVKKQEKSMGIIRDVDETEVRHLLAFHVKAWPPQAAEWKTRSRAHGWPNAKTIERVVTEGVHVIPMKHKQTISADIEWKLSFDLASKTIIVEEVDEIQKQAFMFFHLLCLHTLSENLLTSVHIKTAFLHMCEQVPSSTWYSNTAQCSLVLIDRLIEYVHNKNLPCFFMSENNLLDHLSDLEITKLKTRLAKARKNPLEELLSLTDHYTMLDVFPYNLDIRSLLNNTLKDSKTYTDKSQAILESFMRVSNAIVNGFYHEFAFDHCCSTLDDLVDHIIEPVLGKQEAESQREYIPHLLNQRNIDFSNELHPSDIWKAITFARYLIRRYDTDKQGPGLHEHLACLYHAAAHIFPSDRLSFLEDADREFTLSLKRQGKGCGPGMYVEYSQFLVSCERYDEAIPLLRDVVKKEKDLMVSADREATASLNYYGRMEGFVLDDFLKREIEARKFIEVYSCVYAYYLLQDIYDRKKQVEDSREILDQLSALGDQMKDPMTYSLLGYAAKKHGDQTLAVSAFQKALSLEPKNILMAKLSKSSTASKEVKQKPLSKLPELGKPNSSYNGRQANGSRNGNLIGNANSVKNNNDTKFKNLSLTKKSPTDLGIKRRPSFK